jgi:hypothetical protein
VVFIIRESGPARAFEHEGTKKFIGISLRLEAIQFANAKKYLMQSISSNAKFIVFIVVIIFKAFDEMGHQ